MEHINPSAEDPLSEPLSQPLPLSSVSEAPASPILQPAGFLRRVLAFGIDLFIIQFLYLLLMVVGFLAIRQASGGAIPEEEMVVSLVAPFAAAWFLLLIGYFTFFHSYGGQTPAKMLIRIKVVTAQGTPPSPLRALLRTFGYFLSSFFFGVGFLLAIFEKKKRGLHDLLAQTEVILA
ncbi:MAG: RDD family protein [Nitrospirae bacterium]|nr:RDD family protein [Candidatus Manganitrophaceae bacterium]